MTPKGKVSLIDIFWDDKILSSETEMMYVYSYMDGYIDLYKKYPKNKLPVDEDHLENIAELLKLIKETLG